VYIQEIDTPYGRSVYTYVNATGFDIISRPHDALACKSRPGYHTASPTDGHRDWPCWSPDLASASSQFANRSGPVVEHQQQRFVASRLTSYTRRRLWGRRRLVWMLEWEASPQTGRGVRRWVPSGSQSRVILFKDGWDLVISHRSYD
jgi:hypothetical protein